MYLILKIILIKGKILASVFLFFMTLTPNNIKPKYSIYPLLKGVDLSQHNTLGVTLTPVFLQCTQNLLNAL